MKDILEFNTLKDYSNYVLSLKLAINNDLTNYLINGIVKDAEEGDKYKDNNKDMYFIYLFSIVNKVDRLINVVKGW